MPRLDPARLAGDVVDLLQRALRPVLVRLGALDDRLTALSATVADTPATLTALAFELGAARERIALLEARPPLAGPMGDPGTAGVGLADPAIEFDGQRTLTICLTDGRRHVVTPPILIYQGVYTPGRLYAAGDAVTAGGNLWYCNAATTLRPG